MKPTRILLADPSGILGETVLGLPQVVRNMALGPCTVRSAAPAESLSRWHPDLVLMDAAPSEEPAGTAGRAEDPGRDVRRVVVLTLCYEEAAGAAPGGEPEEGRGQLASATVQLIDLPGRGDGAERPAVTVTVRQSSAADKPFRQQEIQFEDPAGAAGSPRWLMWRPAPLWRVRVGPKERDEAWRLRLVSDKNPEHESE